MRQPGPTTAALEASSSSTVYEFGPFRLDSMKRVLIRDGRPVPLTPKALDVLLVLVANRGRTLDKDDLLEAVWPGTVVEENNLARNVSALRKALGEKDGEHLYVVTVPGRGYRFVAPVQEVPPLDGDAVGSREASPTGPRHVVREQDNDAEAATPAQPRPRRRFSGPAAALLAVAGIAAALWTVRSTWPAADRSAAPANPDNTDRPARWASWRDRPLAVLPFINLEPDPQTDFLGFSLADAIITRLGTVRALEVRAPYAVYKYRSQAPTLQQVAQDLNVKLIMTGSYLKEGDSLRVTAEMVDVATSESLYREAFEIKYGRLTAVHEVLARGVISALHVSLSPQEREAWETDMPRDPLAYEFFLRGRDDYEASRRAHGIEFFERSVSIDPQFARAWVFLGSAYALDASLRLGGRELYDKAQAAYAKAIALNPADPRPHVHMADILIETNRVEDAVVLLRGVLEQHPRDVRALWGLAYAYRYAGLLEESVAACERAAAIDRFTLKGGDLILAYLHQGQYDEFLRSFTPNGRSAYQVFYAGFARYHRKDYAAAVRDLDRAYELDPSLVHARVGKALSHALKRNRAAALHLLQATEREIEAREVGDAEALYKLAQAYAVLKEKEAALRVLRHSIEGGFFPYPYFRSDPLLETIRQDGEYVVLLDQARQRHERFKQRFLSPTSASGAARE